MAGKILIKVYSVSLLGTKEGLALNVELIQLKATTLYWFYQEFYLVEATALISESKVLLFRFIAFAFSCEKTLNRAYRESKETWNILYKCVQ